MSSAVHSARLCRSSKSRGCSNNSATGVGSSVNVHPGHLCTSHRRPHRRRISASASTRTMPEGVSSEQIERWVEVANKLADAAGMLVGNSCRCELALLPLLCIFLTTLSVLYGLARSYRGRSDTILPQHGTDGGRQSGRITCDHRRPCSGGGDAVHSAA